MAEGVLNAGRARYTGQIQLFSASICSSMCVVSVERRQKRGRKKGEVEVSLLWVVGARTKAMAVVIPAGG